MDKEAIKKLKKEAKIYLKKFKIGTIQMFKNLKQKENRKKELANCLTFIRLITPFITILLSTIGLITNISTMFSIAGIITILGGSTDCFDGMVARKTKNTSEYGKQLDQITDKVFSILIGIDLIFINPMFLIPILGETVIAITNLKYKLNHNHLTHKSTLIGKIKEWPLFLTLGLGYFCPVNMTCYNIVKVLLSITLILQSGTAISYIINNEKELKKINKINTINEIKTDGITIEKDEKIKTYQKTNDRLKQYKDLKKLLEENINKDEIEKTYQKTKK